MNFLKTLFAREKKPDLASVRLEKLDKWIDLQFKDALSTTVQQLHTNYDSLIDQFAKLEPIIANFENTRIPDTKIHIYQLALEYKRQLIESVKAILALRSNEWSDNLVSIRQFYLTLNEKVGRARQLYGKVAQTLEEFVKQTCDDIYALLNSINQNHAQAMDILDQKDIATYISIKSTLAQLFEKFDSRVAFNNEIKEIEVRIAELTEHLQKISQKILFLESDPRYLMEKDIIHRAETRFRHSFYELELMDQKSKYKQIADKQESYRADIEAIHTRISALNIEAHKHLLKSKILSQFNIEVEIVE